MADLSWDPEDEREWVDLHMPPEDLTELIRRLRDEALGGLKTERDELRAAAGSYEAAHAACEDILVVLAERHGGEIRVSRAWRAPARIDGVTSHPL